MNDLSRKTHSQLSVNNFSAGAIANAAAGRQETYRQEGHDNGTSNRLAAV